MSKSYIAYFEEAVNKTNKPVIKLLYQNSEYFDIISPNQCVRGISHQGQRPIAFHWYNIENTPITPELIEWIYTEFKHCFHRDAFRWRAACIDLPIELKQHLLENP